MTTEQYSIGYDAGYQDGFDAALAEPVKQEQVAWMNTNGAVNKLREAGWAMNTAPVDAKAIRAETLEEAAKWLAESGLIGSNDCAAAIRNLKVSS